MGISLEALYGKYKKLEKQICCLSENLPELNNNSWDLLGNEEINEEINFIGTTND